MIEILPNLKLFEFLKNNLVCKGRLFQKENRYLYLKIDDHFIHKLYPFIDDPDKKVPDYFSADNDVGAHISVIYPEETGGFVPRSAFEQEYKFRAEAYFKADLGGKIYFGCTVASPALTSLRAHLGLSTLLNFRGTQVPLHFTIAVKKRI